jgi:hypothetical protein
MVNLEECQIEKLYKKWLQIRRKNIQNMVANIAEKMFLFENKYMNINTNSSGNRIIY